MEINTELTEDTIQVNFIAFQKMQFLFNAINEGWTIKKINNTYIFRKKHEGKHEVFQESYLLNFIADNLKNK